LNARKLLEMGSAKMILDSELTGEVLAGRIRELYSSDKLRVEMHRNSESVGRPEACGRVVDIAMSLLKST